MSDVVGTIGHKRPRCNSIGGIEMEIRPEDFEQLCRCFGISKEADYFEDYNDQMSTFDFWNRPQPLKADFVKSGSQASPKRQCFQCPCTEISEDPEFLDEVVSYLSSSSSDNITKAEPEPKVIELESKIEQQKAAKKNSKPAPQPGTSRYKGVCWNKRKKKWRARLSNKGTREFLGDWDTEEKAALAYDKRVRQIYGCCDERLNFPDTPAKKETGCDGIQDCAAAALSRGKSLEFLSARLLDDVSNEYPLEDKLYGLGNPLQKSWIC